MRYETIATTAEKQGDFYLYFNRINHSGITYLVGTMDFDNPYILNRMENRKNPCGLPYVKTKSIVKDTPKSWRLKVLKELAEDAVKKGSVLVYSWSSDRFRLIPMRKVTSLQPLSSVLRNAH